MRNAMRCLVAATLLLMSVGVVAPATAAPPITERVTYHFVGSDPQYAGACGVEEVIVTLDAHGTTRYWEEEGRRLADVNTGLGVMTLTAGDNTYRFSSVGMRSTHLAPDGTATIMLAGQRPLDFIGVAKVNLFTGELILETPHGYDYDRMCAALTRH